MRKEKQQLVVNKEDARRLAVVRQCLVKRPQRADSHTILHTIIQVGLLQLDAVNVVDRSHYLVLLSRLGNYKRSDLDALLYPEHLLFEHWAHAACLIPTQDYSYMAPAIRRRLSEPLSPRRMEALGGEPKKVLDYVMAAITKNGPMMSRDFAEERSVKRAWWNRKPAKVALDWLHYTGRLMIERRVNFQCVYNLPERVLPNAAQAEQHETLEWERWSILRSIRCLGIGTPQHIADYYRQPLSVIKRVLDELVRSNEVAEVKVDGLKGQWYMLSSDVPIVRSIQRHEYQSNITCLLSPFDNLIWHRARARELFDFEYCNEMYTPVARRQRVHGYYVMPIFHRGRLVGRLDPKVDRRSETLVVHNIALEQTTKVSAPFVQDLAKALLELMSFSKCRLVSILSSRPGSLKRLLSKEIG